MWFFEQLLRIIFPTLVSFQRLDELDRFSKLFSTFVRSYQNVLVDNIETFQNVSRRSMNRLSGSYLGQS